MQKTTAIINALEAVSEYSGRLVSWLVLLLVLLTLIITIPRYVLSNEWFLSLNLLYIDWESVRTSYNYNVNALADSTQFVHAVIFMVGVSYALKTGDHVRIDILYQHMNERRRAWVNVTGFILLFLPTFAFILIISWPYVLNSWDILEGSSKPGGLPVIYILKTFLVIMPVLMILQGTAIFLTNLRVLQSSTEQEKA